MAPAMAAQTRPGTTKGLLVFAVSCLLTIAVLSVFIAGAMDVDNHADPGTIVGLIFLAVFVLLPHSALCVVIGIAWVSDRRREQRIGTVGPQINRR